MALTFDDGPSAEWTPKILDILKQKGVKATFFIVGENGETNPGLVQRILAEGHEIGNHTFTHPNIAEASAEGARVELNATQRLVEALTGRSMRLFRPPFFGDAEPTTPDEIEPVKVAQTLGYVTVGLRVDPDDWQGPSADLIVQRIMDRMADTNPETRGQVVLLHDAGGDRSHTVAALPRIIDALRAKGLEIVPVSQLAGWSFDQVMPPLPPEDRSALINWYVFITASWLQATMHWLFMLAIGLGLARLLALCGLTIWGRYKSTPPPPISASDGVVVSVLIPAFNEAKVIAGSVARILDSGHAKLEVIVIDDGSTDGTSDVVRERFGDRSAGEAHHDFKRRQGESGQHRARCIARRGRRGSRRRYPFRARHHRAAGALVRRRNDRRRRRQREGRQPHQSADPLAGARVHHRPEPGAPRAGGAWTASPSSRVPSAPGAGPLCRSSAASRRTRSPRIRISPLPFRRRATGPIFDPDAVAWTEAPDTVAGLAKQRFRWSFGTLQCLWKHADVTLRPRYGALGLVALPQAWLFQIVLGLISPFVDLLLIVQVDRRRLPTTRSTARNSIRRTSRSRLFYYALFITGRRGDGRRRLPVREARELGACCGGSCCSGSATGSYSITCW